MRQLVKRATYGHDHAAEAYSLKRSPQYATMRS